MNVDDLTDAIEKVFEDYVRDLYDLNNVDARDLCENIALHVVNVLGLVHPSDVPAPSRTERTPRATATSVSAALGRYRDDEDGKPLGRAVVRQTRNGPYQYGGYKVSSALGRVEVSWVSPDDMTDEESIREERTAMLTWYQDILVRSGYTVDWDGKSYSLTVSR